MRSGSREGRRREAACENRRRAVLLLLSSERTRRRGRRDGERGWEDLDDGSGSGQRRRVDPAVDLGAASCGGGRLGEKTTAAGLGGAGERETRRGRRECGREAGEARVREGGGG